MIKKVINCNAAVLAVVLLTSFPSSSLGQNRDQKDSQKGIKKQGVSKEAEDERARKKQERIKQALNIVETVLIDTKNISNPVVRIKTRILAADAYWDSQPERRAKSFLRNFPRLPKSLYRRVLSLETCGPLRAAAKHRCIRGCPLTR